MDPEVLYAFAKNESEEIRFTFREYKNRYYMDLRLYFIPSDSDEMCPTKKGLTLSVEFLPELKKGIAAVEETFAKVLKEKKKSA